MAGPQSFAGKDGIGIYDAILYQTALLAPVVRQLSPRNTIIGVVWTYVDVGIYQGTLNTELPYEKIFGHLQFGAGNAVFGHLEQFNSNAVLIECYNNLYAPVNVSDLIHLHLEIWP